MKKILIILSFFAMITSCGKLEDLNQNIKDPAVVPGETLFTGAQKRIIDQMVSTNVNLNVCRLFVQYWTETTYFDESNYDLTTRSQPDGLWDLFYVNVLKNLEEAKTVITATPSPAGEDPAVKQNKLAIAEIMAVYTWDVLVTTFGNVPYSDAINIEIPLPKYDDALTVSTNLLSRLDAAIGQLNDSFDSYGSADNMYGGNVALWAKFANSLKLRMAMELSDVTSLQSTVKAAVESAAPNVLSSNADNAKIIYLSAMPNTNPLYVDLVASGRNDFVAASTIVDSMNSLADPRRPFFFTQLDTSSEAGVEKLAYVGGICGASNNFLAYSHVAPLIQTPTFPGTMFDYAEVEFLLAEAVERGFDVGGTAEEHYNNAIAASIEDWGGTALEAAAYLANPKVAYATADGDWKQKIGVQSWIAYYNRGFEAWTQFRRLDYPKLVAPEDALSALPIRYTYPINEQTLNGTNWEAASTAIGGDAVDTPLFWDTDYSPAK
jgi:hypothetical protein